MNALKLITLTIAITVSVLSGTVWAQQESGMSLSIVAWEEVEVTDANGDVELQRVTAASIVPGDTVVYVISYVYGGEEPADNVVINNTIPEFMLYQDGTAIGVGTTATFSVDDGGTFNTPENLSVVEDDGTARAATVSDYTSIRWTFNAQVLPEAEGYVEYRATLE
jgi:uncharacterized repeat protein (TIGR01451 family)